MSITFDPKVVPVTGDRVLDYRAKFKVEKPGWEHEVHQCPGCRHSLYLVANAVGELQARFPNRQLMVMCEDCSQPWVREITKRGGVLTGSTDCALANLKRRVDSERARQAGAN